MGSRHTGKSCDALWWALCSGPTSGASLLAVVIEESCKDKATFGMDLENNVGP